jgi:hypothetical protein
MQEETAGVRVQTSAQTCCEEGRTENSKEETSQVKKDPLEGRRTMECSL